MGYDQIAVRTGKERMSLIPQGVTKGLIKFDDEQKYVTYVHQNKKRNYTNPEEQVQVETFLKLILTYGYDTKRIRLFERVTMGSSVKEADIIVYNDDQCKSPHIVVECKKQDVSEAEFVQAVEQAFSYAVAEGASFVWVTSGIKDQYYQVPKEKPKDRITIPDIPRFGVTKLARYKYAKSGGKSNGQQVFELEVVTEDELTRRFKQAHQSLWGGGQLNPSEAFDELDKLIFCKLWDEKKPRKKGEPYDFQIFQASDDGDDEKTVQELEQKANEELSQRIKALYNEGRKKDPEVFKDDIRLSSEKLRTVVSYLEGINLGRTDLDSEDLIKRSGNDRFKYNQFNFIITNPPFGSVIKQTEQAYMNQYGFALKPEDWLNPKSKPTPRETQNTEILFIEQCHQFLVEGGYLAIVVPDGILTNSSLQYVRDGIEEKYRIVAVVSLPQTAFQATGAGVKSSVLFLRKHTQSQTEKIQSQKSALQDEIKIRNNYLKELEQIDNDKKCHIRDLRGFENPQNLSGKALTNSEAYKEWKKEITAEYNEKIDALKETLTEQYTEEKQQMIDDYPIFMAIAEDIGYDATGKPTSTNELDFISQELARFIEAIKQGEV